MRHWTIVLAAIAVTGIAAAAGAQTGDSLTALAKGFVEEDGYEAEDADALSAAIEERLAADPRSALRPGSNLGPVVKAVLALEAAEGVVERARYRIRYGMAAVEAPPAADPVPVSFVQVDRFNLGPAIREALVADLGEDNVAPPEAFGEGPHVSWRVVTRPLMGNAADIVAAARAELADPAAEGMTCLRSPCLSTDTAIEGAAPWSEMEEMDLDRDASYEAVRDGLPTPAAAVDRLMADVGLELREGVAPTEPFAEAVVEVNLAQDAGLDAALREGALMDDSLRAAWRRIAAIAGGADASAMVFGAEAFECRRGPGFAEPGAFCP